MSSPTVSTVAIAGITGKLGQLIAQAILSYPQSHLLGFCRDPSKLPPSLTSSNPRVTIHQGSSATDDFAAARTFVRGSDVVICAYLGPNDFMVRSQKLLIDAAAAEHVPRYIASDWALDYTKLKPGDLPPKDPMIEIKAYLEEKKEIKGVHILNGAFMTMVQVAFQQDPVGYWGSGDEKWDFISYELCAEFTAAIAMNPSAVGIIKVRGDRLSIKEAADIYAKHTGQQKLNLKQFGTQAELREKVDQAREKGEVGWPNVMLFYTYWMNEDEVTGLGGDDELANERYPQVKAQRMEEWVGMMG